MNLIKTVLADLHAPLDRDPAARGLLDVFLSYPGFHAITAHRIIHGLHRLGMPLVPRFLSNVMRFATGIEIHPGARIGPGFFIDHGMGVVIGETAEVGDNVTLYQGVTLGGTALGKGKRHATLHDNVVVGANASVLGAIEVGRNSRVGAGSVVVRDVPPDSTVVGIPARLVIEEGKPVRSTAYVDFPDPQAATITALRDRIEALERRIRELERERTSAGEASASEAV